jgi:hypothetical protein
MGTRNLTCVVVLNFLKELGDLADFKQKVAALTEVEPEALKALWVECGADPDSDMVGMDVSERFKAKYPQFSRDTGAGVLELINEGSVGQVKLTREFARDSLFCEWAFVLDLDNEVLEVHKGFQKRPHKRGRFHDLQPEGRKSVSGDSYYPVALAAEFPFAGLPETDDEFVQACHDSPLEALARQAE